MKRIVISILSILLFFNSSLFVIIYSLKTLEVTQNSESKIQHLRSNEVFEEEICPEITLLKVPLNTYGSSCKIRRVNNDEIIFNGYYFDIICERVTDDTVYILCIQDYEEDEMLRALIVHCDKEQSKGQEMQYFNILFSFLSNVINFNYSYEFPLKYEQIVLNYPAIFTGLGIFDIPDPPPRNPA